MGAFEAFVDGWMAWGRWLTAAIALVILGYRARNHVSAASLAREVLLVALAYIAYFTVRGITEGGVARAFENAELIMSMERGLGLSWERGLQERIIDHHELVTLANWLYVWGHWPLISVAAIWLFIRDAESYRVFRNAFLISGAFGLVIFALFPVAPPRLADDGIVDTVGLYSDAYRALQPNGFVNQYAAIPSFHFGWNLLVSIAIVQQVDSVLPRVAAVIVPMVMLLAIIVTGNHYVVDAAAGGAIALIGLLVALKLSEDGTGRLGVRRYAGEEVHSASSQ